MSIVASVPVIASFTKNGKIKPMYFRYDEVMLKITAIISTREVYSNIEFCCKCIDEEEHIEKDAILLYHIGEHCWRLLNEKIDTTIR